MLVICRSAKILHQSITNKVKRFSPFFGISNHGIDPILLPAGEVYKGVFSPYVCVSQRNYEELQRLSVWTRFLRTKCLDKIFEFVLWTLKFSKFELKLNLK